jgi:hypothetical protein
MGSEFWNGMIEWLKNTVMREGKIERSDLDFIHIIDEPDEVVKHIQKYVII